LINDTPDEVILNTNNNLVWAVIEIDNPVRIADDIVPTETTPVMAGDNVAKVLEIGEKVLSGIIDEYNCALTVMVEPTKLNGAVVEKYVEILVIIPSLGMDHAKLSSTPEDPVKSIVEFKLVNPIPEPPNPRNAGIPARPSDIDVRETGNPDEY